MSPTARTARGGGYRRDGSEPRRCVAGGGAWRVLYHTMPLSRLTSVCSRIAPARRFWFALLVFCAGLGCDRLLTDPLRYGTVDDSVTLASGEPVEGALLMLYTGPRPVQYAQSGRDGTFRFTEVPFGVYGVTIVRPARYALLETLVGGRSTSFIDNLTVNGSHRFGSRSKSAPPSVVGRFACACAM